MAQSTPQYSWEEFLDLYNKSGVNFSDADWKMAQQNPNFGVATVYDKIDFANAATDEERALIHQRTEDRRSSYGGYTGGIDGSQYLMNNLSPINYTVPDKPTYSGSAYSDDLNNLWNQQMNYGSFSFNEAQPTYTNRYDDRIQAKLAKVENPDPFSYNASTDPLYQQYRKQYTREGQRATADALGAAAAASGGLPSSYAQTAAGQAANYYAAQMTDKIPELYQLAYQKYLSDFQMQQAGLAALQTAEQSDYDKYRGLLNQYNINRDFARNIWNDEYNHLANNVQTAQNLSNQEYQMYLDALNQYNIDRNFGYGQYIDELNSQAQERADKQTYAQLAASMGDYSYMNQLGINTANNPVDYERRYNEAVLAAQYGDYSGLLGLGIDPNMLNVNNAALAGGGKYSGDGGYYLSGGYSNGGTYTGTGGTYTGSTSTGVDNEGYGDSDIRALQSWLGVDVDGQVGPLTRQAIQNKGLHSVAEAYNAMIGEGVLPAPIYDTGTDSPRVEKLPGTIEEPKVERLPGTTEEPKLEKLNDKKQKTNEPITVGPLVNPITTPQSITDDGGEFLSAMPNAQNTIQNVLVGNRVQMGDGSLVPLSDLYRLEQLGIIAETPVAGGKVWYYYTSDTPGTKF